MTGGLRQAAHRDPTTGAPAAVARFEHVADRPSAYLPHDRRRALAAGTVLPDRVHGSALFADISGFTPLTEALATELGSQRASETLTGHLNRVFHAVIAELDRFGGDVIYFSGDAITCWIDGDDGSRAAACGLAMRDAMTREGEIVTPGGLSVQLALKVAIAVGPARRFVVGDPDIQLLDVLAGGLIDRLIAAEGVAEKNEVVLNDSALDLLGARVELSETRTAETGERVGVLARLVEAVPDAPASPVDRPLEEELVRPWLLPEVYERLSTGRGEFLAELRPAFPVFVHFAGIDYDSDESANEKLDEFVRAAQRILADYGGNLLQLTLGDKGAHLYGVFGTPVAHEDDAARACAAALELQALEASTAAREIQIGITHGRLRSGTYGHEERRTFVCLGDAVNLAARLMSKAPHRETYVSELVRRLTGDGFEWVELEPLTLKGKSAPVVAFSLAAAVPGRTRRVVRYTLPIFGRTLELELLEARLATARSGQGRIVGVSAEAGMGKSRLVAEFARSVRARDLLVAFGECQSFGTSTSYFPWREVWRALLDIPESLPAGEQVAALERALAVIDPALVPRAPVLDVLFGIPIPDTELTATFDAKLRKTSLESLLAECLHARARDAPFVLVIEDCHWLDPLSRDLLEAIARTAPSCGVLLVLAYRPEAALPQGLALGRLPHLEELELSALGDGELGALVEAKLAALTGDDAEPARSLIDLVAARAQGNPFYAEELLNFVHDQGVDPSDERALQALELPGSLHSLILSRIDTLNEAPRRTLKVASVVGRVFRAPVLPGVYPELGAIDDVRAHLGTLRVLDLVNPDREEDESYLFKHAVTQEVAYESLPYALRATLHDHVGRYVEEHEPDAIDQSLDLLAHHFWHSDDRVKARHYLERAGRAAQSAYANAAAIDYYERLATLVPEADRVGILLELGKVLELVGSWERAEQIAREALALAESVGDERSRARCVASLAEIARKQGRLGEAAEHLADARSTFERAGDDEGLGLALHVAGTVAAQAGDYEQARDRYEASLEIRRRLGDVKGTASMLSNLGVVAEFEARYPAARDLHEQALELREQTGDRWAIANSLTNLGMIALLVGRAGEALDRFEHAMRLNREVGDTWMVALTHNNLGNAARALGDHATARAHYGESLLVYRDYADKWATAQLLEDIARLAALAGEVEPALELLGAADSLREEVGAPRAAAHASEIAADIDPRAAGLDAAERDGARERGLSLGLEEAVEAAAAACRVSIS